MNKHQLVVSELSWNTTENKLKRIFSKVGKVENITLIKDEVSGISLGQAFVSMCNNSDAEKAAKTLNKELVDGKEIQISITSSSEKRLTKALLLNA